MNITEDYVSFEIAKLLKKKGFNEKCRGFYVLHASGEARFCISTSYEEGWNFNKEEKFVFAAPTIQMVMKWLYKNYGIYITILQVEASTVTMEQEYFFYRIQKNRKNVGVFTDKFKEPEQSANSAIKYTLENLI